MRNLLNLLTLLILTANFANGQTMDNILQELIDNKLIEQKQTKDFEELVKQYESQSNAVYLSSLFQLEFKKSTGRFYSEFGTYFSFDNEKPTPTEQATINEELVQYLSKLRSCKLINENQLDHFQTKINNNEYVHLFHLLPSLIGQVAFKEYMNPTELRAFADKLRSKEIVSVHYDKLVAAIEQEKLQNPIDFLDYCNKAVIISEQDYPNEPEQYLKLIHQKTASVIPELGFTDFEFQVVLDSLISDSRSKFYDFVVSLRSNGKKYKQKSSYHLYNPIENQYYGNKVDPQEYYKIFNKILTDLQSPYRLHEVEAYQANATEWKTFGMLALTKEQADVLQSGEVYGAYFTPSHENFKNKLTSRKIEQTIDDYKEIGLLSHLTAEQIEQSKGKVSEQENNNLNDVLMAFPDVIYRFDRELENLEDPYAALIRAYKKISHDKFGATEISDNFNLKKKNKVDVKFKIGNKPYHKRLKIKSDWIDTDFLSFIRSVVIGLNLEGQFYELYTDGHEASMIYLTKAQYDYLRTNKLLVFGDERQEEE